MVCNVNGTLLMTVLPPLLITEFVLGILGNSLALWIFCFYLKPWKSTTVLLFNLAVADFLLNIALPFRASYYISDIRWMFGDVFCNICLFMLATNRSSSTFFLMAIAVDRYMRVVNPHHPINFLSASKAMCGAAMLWLLTISMTAPILTLQHINTTRCESFRVDTSHVFTWHKFQFLVSFYIPLVVILFCTVRIVTHLRGRRLAKLAKIKKALCNLMVVVVLFVVCFLPSNITHLLIWIRVETRDMSDLCTELEDLTSVFYITICMTYLNSMLDPLVYYFFSSDFKNSCRKMLHLPETDSAKSKEDRSRESGTQSFDGL